MRDSNLGKPASVLRHTGLLGVVMVVGLWVSHGFAGGDPIVYDPRKQDPNLEVIPLKGLSQAAPMKRLLDHSDEIEGYLCLCQTAIQVKDVTPEAAFKAETVSWFLGSSAKLTWETANESCSEAESQRVYQTAQQLGRRSPLPDPVMKGPLYLRATPFFHCQAMPLFSSVLPSGK